MVISEREMVRQLKPNHEEQQRFTSLQPTYEDSVPAEADDHWESDQDGC